MKILHKTVGYVCDNIWFRFDIKLFGLPMHVSPPHVWWYLLNTPGQRCGLFHKRVKDAYNPRRWGGHILGFEIGCRG